MRNHFVNMQAQLKNQRSNLSCSAMLDDFLDDTTAVRMQAELIQMTINSIDDELQQVWVDLFEALLNDISAMTIIDT